MTWGGMRDFASERYGAAYPYCPLPSRMVSSRMVSQPGGGRVALLRDRGVEDGDFSRSEEGWWGGVASDWQTQGARRLGRKRLGESEGAEGDCNWDVFCNLDVLCVIWSRFNRVFFGFRISWRNIPRRNPAFGFRIRGGTFRGEIPPLVSGFRGGTFRGEIPPLVSGLRGGTFRGEIPHRLVSLELVARRP